MTLWDVTSQLEKYNETLDRHLNSIFYGNEFLNETLKTQHTTLRDMILKQMGALFSSAFFGDREVKLPLIWQNYQSSCVRWCYEWRMAIKESQSREQQYPRRIKNITVEFRVMTNKISKMMKIFHRFYYQILEYITCHFDTSLLIPSQLTGDLNLEGLIQKMPHLASRRHLLQPNDKATVHVIMTFYYCLLFLGKIRYHQTILEDRSYMYANATKSRWTLNNDRNNIREFNKARRYWNMATILVPSMGETYYQLSKLASHNNDYVKKVYYLIRTHFARSNQKANPHDYNDIIQFFQNKSWKSDGYDVDLLINHVFEIMRHYLMFGITPDNTNNNEGILDNESEQILHLKHDVLICLQTETLLANTEVVNDLIVVLIGIFAIVQDYHIADMVSSSSKLNKSNECLLEFILDVIFQIIRHINKSISTNPLYNKDNLLPFIVTLRVINCWIKSNIVVLKFAHRYLPICHIICEFLKTLKQEDIKSSPSLHGLIRVNKRPHRLYLFEEDVTLREFTCIGCGLSDFDDTDIFNQNNVINRLTGHAPKACLLQKEEEFSLRLQAIVVSMKRFLNHNKCGVDFIMGEKNLRDESLVTPTRNAKIYRLTKKPHMKSSPVREDVDSSILESMVQTQHQQQPELRLSGTESRVENTVEISSSPSQLLTQDIITSDMLQPSQSQSRSRSQS